MDAINDAWNYCLDAAGPFVLRYGPAMALAVCGVIACCLVAMAGLSWQNRKKREDLPVVRN